MTMKAIQQFQLRPVIHSEKRVGQTLEQIKEAGYEGIELNGFMIKRMPIAVRMLLRAAGMPIGSSGKLNWNQLIQKSGLKVVSIHEDLNSILKNPQGMIDEAEAFGTKYMVVTGMHRFDYSNQQEVLTLANKLNIAGKELLKGGIHLLYHNHNCEFRKVAPLKTAFELILEKTDPEFVNFEFDAFWPTEAGVNALSIMNTLGSRMKLFHITDRGTRVKGPTGSILKSDCMELGYGNMNLIELVQTGKKFGVEAVILETHRNWVDKSPVKSFQLSAKFMNEHV